MKQKATEEALGELHALVSTELKRQITMKHYKKKAVDEEGREVVIEVGCPMDVISQARQFLKDNKIEIDMGSLRQHPEMLQPDDLPFADEERPELLN
jgi:hypothetical protein